MRKPTAILTLLMATLLVASANAHLTVEADHTGLPADGVLIPGETYTIPSTLYVNCAVIGSEYEEGQTLVASIANRAEYAWLNASEEDITIEAANCEPYGDDTYQPDPDNPGLPNAGVFNIYEVDVTFTVDATAPAFTDFNFQPGADGEANQGGNFSAAIAYVPAFTAPTALTFDATGGGATATIPLTTTANADSVYNFEVTSFTFDGEDAPESATAHIMETLEVETGIFSEAGSTSTSVDLHFGTGDSDHGDMEHDDSMESSEDMEMEHDDGMDAHSSWETAVVTLEVTLAAQEDLDQSSVPRTITLTFNNADVDAMGHGEEHEHEDDSNFLPGFGGFAAIVAIGLVALARRRV